MVITKNIITLHSIAGHHHLRRSQSYILHISVLLPRNSSPCSSFYRLRCFPFSATKSMLAYVHIYICDPEMVIMILSVGRLFTEIEPAGAAALLEVW